MSVLTCSRVRFGPFELDPQSGELFKLGHKLNLHGQPIEVLSILLERPGEVVSRDELCKRLWPEDTFVDFDHSLNTAIKKLRQALDDDPEAPRYIETLPKKGYRFNAKVEAVVNNVAAAGEPQIVLPEPSVEPRKPIAAPSPEPAPVSKSRRWRYAVAAALILVIAAGALYWLYRPRTPVVTAIHQLTNTGRRKSHVGGHHPGTDGTRIYFDEFDGEKWRLAQVSAKGGKVSYIETPLIGNVRVLDISSDGSELLLLDWHTVLDDKMWSFTLPNGPARRLNSLDGTRAAVFVPGSKDLLYSPTGSNRVFRARPDGSDPHLLLSAPSPLLLVGLAVSPDGQRVRFSASEGIWEAHIDGTGLRRFLPEHKDPISVGYWSPDGRTYGFASSSYVNGPSLWGVTESKLGPYRFVSQPVQLTFGPVLFPFWTPSKDGQQIFALGQTFRGELSVHDPKTGLFSSYLNGISAAFADFSRDGQWVAYVAYPEGTLWRSRVDGSERLQLTFPPMGPVLNPRWSPDGRLIAFTEWGQNRGIYLVQAEGNAPMLLLSGDFYPVDPTWSPDSKSIAYSGAAPRVLLPNAQETEVRILNLETKQSQTLPGSTGLFSARWSPDGRYLVALSKDAKRLFLYSFESNQWKPLPFSMAGFKVGWPAWSHDSRYVYAMSEPDVYRIQIPEGRSELAARITGFDMTCPLLWGGWFGLTPDDRVIVLRDRGVDELYALDLEYR